MNGNYISLEAAIEKHCELCHYMTYEEDCRERCMEFKAFQEMLPSADVVEVVRCKDCYAYRRDPELARARDLDPDYYCALLCCELDPDGFCSYGKTLGSIRKPRPEVPDDLCR